ncbi:FAD:protein FMN transferase [Crocinitomix sp.]|nr:FAD:protein FMN transferase [Crocinitomix sp.]
MKYIFVLLAAVLFACDNQPSSAVQKDNVSPDRTIQFYGNTQGTSYAIVCNDPIEFTQKSADDIFRNFDLALSGYIDSSVVTKLNVAPAGDFFYTDKFNYFNRCYQLSQVVYELTNGDFDPTVYPLVDGWGFMKDIENVPDSATVESLRSLIGFDDGMHFKYLWDITEEGDTITANHFVKRTPGAKLDFNAIAQGLSVDVIAEELERLGASNYYVEIGGEIRVHGLNSDGVVWRIGIDKPIERSTEETRSLQEVVKVDNRAIATSGSYRKFYEKDGVKYSHTLNPKTGYPVNHTLLSATVVAQNCAMADAMATSFMVMGTDGTISFLNAHPELDVEVYLIYMNANQEYETYYTPGFGEMIVVNESE